ncbi:MAG: DUF2891 domain-containing protein [Bradymonadales bacterium]|nr:DUF2891 domain-containing protein [Bradymonadales bacterium]
MHSDTDPNQPPLASLLRKYASALAALPLDCIDREYPCKPGHVLSGPGDIEHPRQCCPAFYGCFDWHSAVHAHWCLVRLLGSVDELPEAPLIRKKLQAHLTEEHLELELGFFRQKRNRIFERPYGWAWFLRLHAELCRAPDRDIRDLAETTEPLYRYFSNRLGQYLQDLSRPVRHGTHNNTAFSMAHGLDAARVVGDSALEVVAVRRARDFFLGDNAYPAHLEPSGEDFISPCLTEADLMRRVLEPDEFSGWFDRFVPRSDSEEIQGLLHPAPVTTPKDPRIGHLIGLSFQRAWCFRGIACGLPRDDHRRPLYLQAADRLSRWGLETMFDSGYGGRHWLATFAVFYLSGAGETGLADRNRRDPRKRRPAVAC